MADNPSNAAYAKEASANAATEDLFGNLNSRHDDTELAFVGNHIDQHQTANRQSEQSAPRQEQRYRQHCTSDTNGPSQDHDMQHRRDSRDTRDLQALMRDLEPKAKSTAAECAKEERVPKWLDHIDRPFLLHKVNVHGSDRTTQADGYKRATSLVDSAKKGSAGSDAR